MSRYRRSQAAGATYFFTVNLADRTSALLTTEIERLRSAYRYALERSPFRTIAVCVMPDHVHAVWQLPEGDADFGKRWGLIKRQFSMGLAAAKQRSVSLEAKREKGIWQRRFWEHQIRDDTDLQRHVDCVHYNPVKHGHAARVSDWPYSSFHRYVREGILPLDWGGSGCDSGGWGEGRACAWARCALPTLRTYRAGAQLLARFLSQRMRAPTTGNFSYSSSAASQ